MVKLDFYKELINQYAKDAALYSNNPPTFFGCIMAAQSLLKNAQEQSSLIYSNFPKNLEDINTNFVSKITSLVQIVLKLAQAQNRVRQIFFVSVSFATVSLVCTVAYFFFQPKIYWKKGAIATGALSLIMGCWDYFITFPSLKALLAKDYPEIAKQSQALLENLAK